MQIRLEEYVRVGGSCPYQEWFDGLDALAAAKVAVAKVRMELGNTSNIKWFRGIGEYVIDWGPARGDQTIVAKVMHVLDELLAQPAFE